MIKTIIALLLSLALVFVLPYLIFLLLSLINLVVTYWWVFLAAANVLYINKKVIKNFN